MTDPLGQSQVLPYLCGLSKLGYSITLISCEKKDRFQKFGDAISGQMKEAGIEWHHYYFSTKPPLVSKFWDINRLKRKAIALHEQKNFAIVHCRSYMASIAGMYLNQKFGIRFIFDMRGFWADERIDGGVWNLRNPVYKLLYNYFKRFEKKSILTADAIICLTENGVREMLSWDYVDNKVALKIHHITTCCDIHLFEQAFTERATRNFTVNKIQFVYIGSIGPWHSFDKLTVFIKAVYNNIPGSYFKLIISSGQEAMEKFIDENKMGKDRFVLKYVPHRQISQEIADTDIAFFFIPHQYSKIASSPTKMGEMLSAGLPVITGSGIGDVDELIRSNKIGYILDEFTDRAITDGVNYIIQQCIMEKETLMIRCRETAEDYFSLEKGIKKYAEIYANLV
jgi:glycosyltransferase involved in cell wall biosynthesis